jgi:hypothetical protein
MQVLAIQIDGRTVALAEGDDVVTRLNGDRLLRDTVRYLKRGGQPLWNGTSPFTARPATDAESDAFNQRQTAGRAC